MNAETVVDLLCSVRQFVTDYWHWIIGVAIPSVSTAVFAYLRRPKSSTKEIGSYFTNNGLLSPPLTRPAYSDRMAYVLAEMSDLAYYQFEGKKAFIDEVIEEALQVDMTEESDIRQFLDQFSTDLMSERRLSLKFFEDLLKKSGFSLLKVIDVGETQGFACKRIADNEPSYVVLAFRGTEKKVSDWLTDARCVPTEEGKTKVHTGFLEAFTKNVDDDGKTVMDTVEEIIKSSEAQDHNNVPLPLFITGHSLGGALALLATKLAAPNVNGACYTFGAPRIGNYEYFRFIKTPVYRIVNSSDVVPRVPPGAGMLILVGIAKAMSWITSFIPAVSSLFDKVEEFLDKLNGYRHFGDLRYLSDVREGKFEDVRLLSNPPLIDRVVWMWRRMAKSLFAPIKSHNMNIYRKKLKQVAKERMSNQATRK